MGEWFGAPHKGGKMSMGTAETIIVAGWYPDPADNALARWWDGSQWASTTRQRHVPTPAQEQHREGNAYFSPVPIRTDATLPPIDPYRPMNRRHDSQGFVSMGVKPLMQFHPTRAYTGSVWALATMPVWTTIVVLALVIGLQGFYTTFLAAMTGILMFLLTVMFGMHDQKVLKDSLHVSTASPWWILLSPLAYLIVRSIYVHRAVGHGWAPFVVYMICSFVPAVAFLAFGYLFTFFASLLGTVS